MAMNLVPHQLTSGPVTPKNKNFSYFDISTSNFQFKSSAPFYKQNDKLNQFSRFKCLAAVSSKVVKIRFDENKLSPLKRKTVIEKIDENVWCFMQPLVAGFLQDVGLDPRKSFLLSLFYPRQNITCLFIFSADLSSPQL
jgi:hypothetical protein